VVVVGGSSGVGLETVRRLAATGARVIATGRDNGKLQEAIGGMGANVSGAAFDACDRGALDAFFEKSGPVDHLVLTLSGGGGAGRIRAARPAVAAARLRGQVLAAARSGASGAQKCCARAAASPS
jgi:NADP-dependent 3-hydroxy acid dehydrogenase YdfG